MIDVDDEYHMKSQKISGEPGKLGHGKTENLPQRVLETVRQASARLRRAPNRASCPYRAIGDVAWGGPTHPRVPNHQPPRPWPPCRTAGDPCMPPPSPTLAVACKGSQVTASSSKERKRRESHLASSLRRAEGERSSMAASQIHGARGRRQGPVRSDLLLAVAELEAEASGRISSSPSSSSKQAARERRQAELLLASSEAVAGWEDLSPEQGELVRGSKKQGYQREGGQAATAQRIKRRRDRETDAAHGSPRLTSQHGLVAHVVMCGVPTAADRR
nr:unnamed protein product [Digitaria exilis]